MYFLSIGESQSSDSHMMVEINTSEIVNIGGIDQYIQIKGKDDKNPLLLFLHGGPGGSVMETADKFTTQLQEHFLVVQWDQRETGKTLELNVSPELLTLDLFKNDTDELVNYLLTKFQRKKLYLVGHSWGTVLGFHIADNYPELLYSFIAISPVINQLKSERITLDMLIENAKTNGDAKAMEELSSVNIPFENSEQLYYDRKWLFTFDGQKYAQKKSFRGFVFAWSKTWFPVWIESISQNLFEDLTTIDCPVFFFVGRKDYQTHFEITEEYYDLITAPQKELYWFENSGHLIPDNEPGLLQEIIIKEILPATH